MTFQGMCFDRPIVCVIVCMLCVTTLGMTTSASAQCQQEVESPCCSHLTGPLVACIENCPTFGSDCCWSPDMSIKTVVASSGHSTGQQQIQFLVWEGRCRYKAPHCADETCTHPGPWIERDCIIAKPAEDDCP